MSVLRSVASILAMSAAAVVLTACSNGLFGQDDNDATAVAVFDVVPGMCFDPPAEPRLELADLQSLPCSTPHTQESYALVTFRAPEGADSNIYPGDAALLTFADGACAEEFADYVGVSYLDSSLFYTSLVPSARSWEQGKDRTITCFVTTTGAPLTASVAGSKL